MKHILLPTDFSGNSWNAIQYAVRLFKDEVCEFTLLNTYNPMTHTADPILGYSPQFGLDQAIKDMSVQNLNEFLEKITKTLKDNPNHSFKTFSTLNNLISGINVFMEENKIDLIVMGTQGATGAKKVLFGSNTVHVFKDVKCPTLAVPSGFEYESLHEILFPTDLLVDYNAFQIEILKTIARDNTCNINALHVSSDELSEEQNSNKLELESQFKETSFFFHLKKGKNVLAAIDEFQINSNIDLLTMINNKHSFFENLFFKSNIDQIGFHLKRPFLVIPAKN